MSLPEFRKYLIDLSNDGLKEDVAALYELIMAKEQGRIIVCGRLCQKVEW